MPKESRSRMQKWPSSTLCPPNSTVTGTTHFYPVAIRSAHVTYAQAISRGGAINALIGLGCSPVLASGTKKLLLKWIRIALRQKRIEVPDSNGPVRWSLDNGFFQVGEDDLGEERRQEISEETSTDRQ